MATLQYTQILVYAGDNACHGGLARAGTAGEDQVIRHLRGLQTFLRAHLLHLDEVGQTIDFFFHALQADEFVEFLIRVIFQGLVHYYLPWLSVTFLVGRGLWLFRLLCGVCCI